MGLVLVHRVRGKAIIAEMCSLISLAELLAHDFDMSGWNKHITPANAAAQKLVPSQYVKVTQEGTTLM